MSHGDNDRADAPAAAGVIKAPQDFWGGLVMVAFAAVAFWEAGDLAGMEGARFGPGTAPRLWAGLLLLCGVAIVVRGLVTRGPALVAHAVRGPLFVVLAMLAFAVAIKPMGLALSTYACFLLAAMGSAETRWKETLITGLVMTGLCVFLFSYLLNLPFENLPNFLR